MIEMEMMMPEVVALAWDVHECEPTTRMVGDEILIDKRLKSHRLPYSFKPLSSYLRLGHRLTWSAGRTFDRRSRHFATRSRWRASQDGGMRWTDSTCRLLCHCNCHKSPLTRKCADRMSCARRRSRECQVVAAHKAPGFVVSCASSTNIPRKSGQPVAHACRSSAR